MESRWAPTVRERRVRRRARCWRSRPAAGGGRWGQRWARPSLPFLNMIFCNGPDQVWIGTGTLLKGAAGSGINYLSYLGEKTITILSCTGTEQFVPNFLYGTKNKNVFYSKKNICTKINWLQILAEISTNLKQGSPCHSFINTYCKKMCTVENKN